MKLCMNDYNHISKVNLPLLNKIEGDASYSHVSYSDKRSLVEISNSLSAETSACA